jgi:hypothetical protein
MMFVGNGSLIPRVTAALFRPPPSDDRALRATAALLPDELHVDGLARSALSPGHWSLLADGYGFVVSARGTIGRRAKLNPSIFRRPPTRIRSLARVGDLSKIDEKLVAALEHETFNI